jgi:predicted phage tail protein
MKVVKVYGALRKRLGQCRFEFDVNTPAQAIKALCVNFPGLDKWLIDSEQDGIGYRVSVGREKISNDPEAFGLPFSDKEVFSITPVIAGAGRGTGQILAGVGLVAFSLAFPGIGAAIGPALMTKIGLLGGSLILSGIATAISPQPDLDSTLDESVQLESFTFSNVVNTQRQGMPVPIAYGRLFVGSAVLSSGLDVDQVQV